MNDDAATSDTRSKPEDKAADPRFDDFSPEGGHPRPSLDEIISSARKKRQAMMEILFEETRKTQLAMSWIIGIAVSIAWFLIGFIILLFRYPEFAIRLFGG